MKNINGLDKQNYDDNETEVDLKNNGVSDELIADEATSYVPAPAGTHIARCVGFINLGTQKQEYQGKPGKDRKKVMLFWELPEELHIFDESKGEEPYLISHIYSLVLGEKATWQCHMEGWTGGKIDKNFDPLSRLGQPCQLNIVHKLSSDGDKVKAKVSSVARLTKNQKCPDRINPIKALLFSKWDEKLFNEQSEWVQKTIQASPEYKRMKAGMPLAEGNNEGKYRNTSNDDLSKH
jgi:hypothetical protein